MTAELGILNKNGIVLATDSATTIGNNKVYNTAKKLFTLDSNHFVGIMIYGNAEFMEVPWEIIISQFRKQLGNEILPKLDDYSEEFLKFLQTQSYLKKEELQTNYVIAFAQSVIQAVFQNIEDDINFLISQGQDVDNSLLIKLLTKQIKSIKGQFSEQYIVELDETEFLENYRDSFNRILRSISVYEDVSKGISEELFNLIYYTIIRDNTFLSSTGIVFAGYGREEVFPCIESFKLYSFIMEEFKYSKDEKAQVGNGNRDLRSTIIPFAQDDVVHTVVQGLDPMLSEYLASKVEEFDENSRSVYTEIIDELSKIQRQRFIDPMLNMISLLPVDETSVIAETLLNLTSFKRKYSTSVETVGGPIDVLSITPNEGPVWIRRKQYFNLEENLGYKLRRQ
ncbi:hypothetical protein [Tetragenococcus halophilus]|uniref:hypothetical protein n=1 Tax=Tetragenococcus halophilus TaxID=51669 RepID=UPI001B52670D|nr:hypothetical protein [Tetragenococcus halophilus]GFK24869.1 hypothetical protein YA163_19320 [Tetragenococcus halophilus]